MTASAVLYAHQGGWDEILMVLAPITVIVLLVRMAERRARVARERRLRPDDDVPRT